MKLFKTGIVSLSLEIGRVPLTTAVRCAVAIVLFGGNTNSLAQLLPNGHYLYPSNPTSADNLTLSLANQGEHRYYRYTGNGYRVSMAGNAITVTLGALNFAPFTGSSPVPREEIDLGRLPAGVYSLTVRYTDQGAATSAPLFVNSPFTVTDARATKVAPWVRRDYSGHWWDPNDGGWGLFIWQDPKSPSDSLLAAWFTYAADGKSQWYVFQPTWLGDSTTNTASMVQTSRQPGPTSPPPAPTALTIVGTASLDFTTFDVTDTGKIIYSFNGGPTLTRNIVRFKP